MPLISNSKFHASFTLNSFTSRFISVPRISYSRMARGTGLYFAFETREDDVVYSPLPLYHSQALLTSQGAMLLLGSSPLFPVN